MDTEDDAVRKAEVLLSPLEGEVVLLAEVNDPTFAEEILGKGVAVRPVGGRVCAPADGRLVSVFETGHAFGMITDHGAEVLVHVGLDTVNLKGKYFTVKKAAGDTVKAGDVILEFDADAIKAEGYDVITPVVISNHFGYEAVETIASAHVKTGEALLELR